MGYLQIGLNDLDGRALIESVNVTIGRQSITEQPLPGTFTCTFYLGQDESIYPIEIGTNCYYYVYDSNGTGSKTRVFHGTVTDVQVNLQWANGQGLFMYTVTAVDGLSFLSRYLLGTGGYVKKFEGNRIKDIMADVFTTYGQLVDVTDIDSPGDYEIAVYNSGQTDAYTLCTQAANSAMGTIYWNQISGRLKYTTYTNRKLRSVVTLSTSDLLAADFTIGASTTRVCNATQLTYGTGSLGTQYQDATSIAKYGIKAGVRNTTLHNVSDANSQAQILLATRKDPSYALSSITVNTALITDALRSQLANIEVGSKIVIDNLPTNEVNSFEGFVESYIWTAARGQDILQMTISSTEEQYSYTLWNQLNYTDTWQTIASASTKWSDLS